MRKIKSIILLLILCTSLFCTGINAKAATVDTTYNMSQNSLLALGAKAKSIVLSPGETYVLDVNVCTTAVSSFYINYQWDNVNVANIVGTNYDLGQNNIFTSHYTITGISYGTTILTIYWAADPTVKITIPITVGTGGNAAAVQAASGDYGFYVYSTFKDIKRQYINATALCGYALPYTGVDGKQYVLSNLQYKIINNYNVTYLYNITDGTVIYNPDTYFSNRTSRSWGAGRIQNSNLSTDYLTHKNQALNALRNCISTGTNTANGTYVTGDFLNL